MDLKIFTVGGTVDKVYFDQLSTYQVGDPRAGDILREADVTLAYGIEELFRKDSLELTDADRRHIVQKVAADPCRRILITHGTDTMAATARELAAVAGKVIVLTGAIRPAGFKSSDAPFNLGCAVGAIQTLPPGVYIVMNGRIFPGDRVRKNRADNRFEPLPN